MENDTDKSICGNFDLLDDPKIFLPIIYIVHFVLGVVGNGILVLLFLMHKQLRDINNAFVTNLALSDFFFVLFLIPIKIYQHYHIYRPLGTTFCAFSIIINYTSQDVSSFSLAAMAYFRYRAVLRPLQSRSHSRDRRYAMFITFLCVLFWIIGIIVAIYPSTQCQSCSTEDHIFQELHLIKDVVGNSYTAFTIFRTIACFLVPFVTIAIFYGIMAAHLCKGQTMLERNSSISARRAARSRKKLGGIVLAIATLFFISWFPHYLLFYIRLFGNDNFDSNVGTFFIISQISTFLPSSLNPLILLATSTGYRKAIRRLVLNCTRSQCTERNFKAIRRSTLTSSLSSRLSRSRRVPSKTSLEMQPPNGQMHL